MSDKHSRAQDIRRRIGHPVIDADGHWLEPVPLFLDTLKAVAGAKVADSLLAHTNRLDTWYGATEEQRRAGRLMRPGWWTEPTQTLDRATAMLPRLLRSRLDEFGIDVGIIYPSLGLLMSTLRDKELRLAAARALNTMTAEMFRPYGDRLLPVAVVPAQTPEEAIEGARYAVETLKFRAILIGNMVYRPLQAPVGVRSISPHGASGSDYFIDALGIDSPYDYDPFWRTCIDLKVAVTAHSGGVGWPDRQSPSNYVYNHAGHFATANDAFCKALILGGVLHRFPELNVGFMEGGAGWAAKLYNDLKSHWNVRNPKALAQNLSPRRLDIARLRSLVEEYGEPQQRKYIDTVARYPSSLRLNKTTDELAARDEPVTDDFAASGIDSPDKLAELFDRCFLGCEADDVSVAWAYHKSTGTKLRPVFGSDIGHFDVADMTHPLVEAYELIEDGYVNEEQFREFTYLNVAQLHTRMNPGFFAGTIVESAVRKDLHAAPA